MPLKSTHRRSIWEGGVMGFGTEAVNNGNSEEGINHSERKNSWGLEPNIFVVEKESFCTKSVFLVLKGK